MPTNSNVISHHWEFGDGTSSNEAAPVHFYPQTGFYIVVHTVTQSGPNGEIFVYTCLKGIWVECNGGGGGVIPTDECCRLKTCFMHPIQDPNYAYYWEFGDGKTSTEMNPCHYYDNVSTYPVSMGGTPTVTVKRCYTPLGGVQTCLDFSVSLVSSQHPAAIYVGEPGLTTSIYVVSSIDGQPLFPGNSLQGPYNGPNGTVPKEVHIMGELQFNKSFDFLNFVDFCMDPCAGMVVEHHRNLKFDNNISVRNKCCLWRSIDIDHSATFTSSNDNTIRGAQYGLRTKSDMAVMDISETHFDSNWVGIFLRHPLTISRFDNNTFVSDYTDPHCTPLPGIPPPSCDNEVQVMAQVPHLQRGFAGIVGKNTILNLPAGSVGSNNDFTYMDNGIWLHDSDAEVRRCNFLEIKDLAYGSKSGNAIRSNIYNGSHSLRQWGNGTSITETTTGIRMYADSYGNILDSRNNSITVSKYGYRLEIGGTLAQGSVIRDNSIQSDLYGIDATKKNAENVPSHLSIAMNNVTVNNGTDEGIGILVNDAVPPIAATTIHDIHVLENGVTLNNGRTGIEVSNFRNADVAFNVVHVNDTGGGGVDPFPPMGIYLEGGNKNLVRCNTIIGTFPGGAQHSIVTEKSYDNLISGNGLSSTAIGIDFRNFCGTTTDLTCNTMQNHLAGLRYWEDARTGNQYYKGNQWLGTWPQSTIGAWHLSTDENVIWDSKYRAKQGTNQWPPSIDVMITNPAWFTNAGNLVICNTGCDVMLQPDSTNELDMAISSSNLSVPANSDIYNWDARRYLYGKLSANAVLANQSTAYSSFLNNQSSTTVGLLYNSAAQVHGLFNLSLSTSQALDANLAAIEAARTNISDMDASLASGILTEEQQASLLADKETELTNLANLQSSTTQIATQLASDRSTSAAAVISSNGGIAVTAQFEQNEKTLLDLYLNTDAKNLPATLAQKAQVLGIAQQCPESGGYSTYWARAWYCAMTGVVVKPSNCLYASERSSEGNILPQVVAEVEGFFTLTPNPAQDFVLVQLGTDADWTDATLSLLDATGIIRMTEMIGQGRNEMNLPTTTLDNGLYWVSIKTQDGTFRLQRLAVIR
ncbi:MAG: hypothetical protein K9J37_22710 [Saprospiraceae bacterium]|nr:hypothetical protein [Saprospiraceae bacterium]MCF8252737.1 hypothetical protein [Saprospiraceae bacterium]MCF8282785.1 hypothetical protein [Bacteroidales bacterium]MCF8313329.1 hypothetical protein [Saprospiraceae bacterium]MCF8441715.1 hypothetical protein [Saprospiraceae bacterium]